MNSAFLVHTLTTNTAYAYAYAYACTACGRWVFLRVRRRVRGGEAVRVPEVPRSVGVADHGPERAVEALLLRPAVYSARAAHVLVSVHARERSKRDRFMRAVLFGTYVRFLSVAFSRPLVPAPVSSEPNICVAVESCPRVLGRAFVPCPICSIFVVVFVWSTTNPLRVSKVHEVHTSEVPASFRDSGEEGKLSPSFFFVCQVGLLLAVTPVPPPPRYLSLSLSLSPKKTNSNQPPTSITSAWTGSASSCAWSTCSSSTGWRRTSAATTTREKMLTFTAKSTTPGTGILRRTEA